MPCRPIGPIEIFQTILLEIEVLQRHGKLRQRLAGDRGLQIFAVVRDGEVDRDGIFPFGIRGLFPVRVNGGVLGVDVVQRNSVAALGFGEPAEQRIAVAAGCGHLLELIAQLVGHIFAAAGDGAAVGVKGDRIALEAGRGPTAIMLPVSFLK